MKVTADNQTLTLQNNQGVWVSDTEKSIEIIQRDEETLWIITPNKVHSFKCLNVNKELKEVTLLHKGNKFVLKLIEPLDEILKSMGLQDALTPKIDAVKAPMPGLVLAVKVQVGDEVKKGDTLVILEAMKMENAIKSPTDAVIAQINVTSGQAVDKNQLLVQFQ